MNQIILQIARKMVVQIEEKIIEKELNIEGSIPELVKITQGAALEMYHELIEQADPAISRRVQDQWIRFAETGDPGAPDLPWPAYEPENRWTMMIGDRSEAVRDPLPEQRALLDPVLDYRINSSYMNMDYNVPFVWKAAGKLLGALLLAAFVLYAVFHGL